MYVYTLSGHLEYEGAVEEGVFSSEEKARKVIEQIKEDGVVYDWFEISKWKVDDQVCAECTIIEKEEEMVGLVHPDNKDFVIDEQRGDIIGLLYTAMQALNNIDKERRYVVSVSAIRTLENAVDLLTKKYNVMEL